MSDDKNAVPLTFVQERNRKKIADQEAELEALLKKTRGSTEDTQTEAEPAPEPVTDDTDEPNVGPNGDDDAPAPENQASEPEAEPDDKPKKETDWKKRYGDLRSHSSKKEKELQAEIDRLKAGHAPPQDKKALKEWMEKNPNAAKIIGGIAREQAREMVDGLDDKLKQIEKERAEIVQSKAMAQLTKVHPDFEKITESDEFRDWLDQQSPVMQSAMYDNAEDWKSASDVLKLYKTEKDIKPKRKPKAEDAAPAGRTSTPEPSAGGKKQWKESEIARMSASEFEANMEDIDAARREGRMIYDMPR